MKKLFLLFIAVCAYFSALQAVPGFFPKISDDVNETWYVIQFRKNGKAIQDMGEGANLQMTKQIDWSDSQLWKIVATETEGEYQIVSKSGRKMAFIGDPAKGGDPNRYGASTTGETTFKINAVNDCYFDIERVGSPNHECLNRKDNGDGGEVGEWTNKDNSWDNHVYFATPREMPKVSEGESEHWYYIYFERAQKKEQNRLKVITDMGEGNNLEQKEVDYRTYNQLWKMVKAEEENEYYFVSKNGAYMTIVNAEAIDGGGRKYQASLDEEKAEAFVIEEAPTQISAWTIRRVSAEVTTTPDNQQKDHRWLNDQVNKTVGDYSQDDGGCIIRFEAVDTDFRELPQISDENYNYWYNLLFVENQTDGKKVITYKGEDQNLMQEAYTEDAPEQMWKFVPVAGSEDEYYVENKNGAKMTIANADATYTGDRTYQASASTEPVKFKFGGGAADYTTWNLLRSGMAGGECINNKADGSVCEWYDNSGGSSLHFLLAEEEEIKGPSTQSVYPLTNNPAITVNGKVISIIGEGIQNVSIYTIAGQVLHTNLTANTLQINEAGCYIVQINQEGGLPIIEKVVIK